MCEKCHVCGLPVDIYDSHKVVWRWQYYRHITQDGCISALNARLANAEAREKAATDVEYLWEKRVNELNERLAEAEQNSAEADKISEFHIEERDEARKLARESYRYGTHQKLNDLWEKHPWLLEKDYKQTDADGYVCSCGEDNCL